MIQKINRIMEESDKLESAAAAARSGWKDGVQSAFHSNHLTTIYEDARQYCNTAITEATGLLAEESKMEELLNKTSRYLN